MRRIALLGALASPLAILLALAGCGQNVAADRPRANTDGADAPSVDVVTVKASSHQDLLELPGASVHGMETTRLFARAGGYVQKIGRIDGVQVDIGSVVSAGDVLAVLDAPDLEDHVRQKEAQLKKVESQVAQAAAAVQQAQAEVVRSRAAVEQVQARRAEKEAERKLAEAEYRRISELTKNESVLKKLLDEATFKREAAQAAIDSVAAAVISAEAERSSAEASVRKAQADQAAAEAQVAVAQAELRQAKTIASFTRIVAPYDGVITGRFVDHGAFVRPATSNSGAEALFEITRQDVVRVVASVPMATAGRIEEGQPITFHNVGGLSGIRVPGTVTRSRAVLDQSSRMLRIDIHLKNPVTIEEGSEVVLRPGMYGTVSVTTQSDDRVFVVPATAVIVADGSRYVMCLEDGRCRKHPVEIAFENAVEVGIVSGIDEGEVLIAKDAAKYQDGQRVQPIGGALGT